MNVREQGFLLLTSHLGDPERKPLTQAQLRTLAARVRAAGTPVSDKELQYNDLTVLGYSREQAQRILGLLSDTQLLEYYLHKGKRAGCTVLTRVSDGYPQVLRQRLGINAPGCLWARGDMTLLRNPCVALVGSRDLRDTNRAFAAKLGTQAAKQGYTLVSGNARGADRTAQEACRQAGGQVIAVLADKLEQYQPAPGVLYLSEDCFDAGFSSVRALSRNRVIHTLGQKTFVAQVSLGEGGTWNGTVNNLKNHWSNVFCYDDGSEAAQQLEQLGAALVGTEELKDLSALEGKYVNLFDR